MRQNIYELLTLAIDKGENKLWGWISSPHGLVWVKLTSMHLFCEFHLSANSSDVSWTQKFRLSPPSMGHQGAPRSLSWQILLSSYWHNRRTIRHHTENNPPQASNIRLRLLILQRSNSRACPLSFESLRCGPLAAMSVKVKMKVEFRWVRSQSHLHLLLFIKHFLRLWR